MKNPQGISNNPIETVEGRAQFVRFLFAGDNRAKAKGANDNEYDDESAETGEDD